MSAQNPFQRASRLQARARVAIAGPPKAGKSMTALRLAFALANANGRNGRVAVIDTEFGSMSKYQGMKMDGVTFDFDVVELRDFAPINYQRLIEAAAKNGYDALIIDSLSHAWIGRGGALDQIDAKGGKWNAWADVTPQQRSLVDAILQAPIDVVATMRVKTEWILEEETNKAGKKVMSPKKVGLATQQREGMDYEFDMVCRIDPDHILKIDGSRCPDMDGLQIAKPDAQFFRPFIEWLGEGGAMQTPRPAISSESNGNAHYVAAAEDFNTRFAAAGDNRLLKIKLLKDELGIDADGWKSILTKRGVETAKGLTEEQQDTLINNLANKLGVSSVFATSNDDNKSGTNTDAAGAVAAVAAS